MRYIWLLEVMKKLQQESQNLFDVTMLMTAITVYKKLYSDDLVDDKMQTLLEEKLEAGESMVAAEVLFQIYKKKYGKKIDVSEQIQFVKKCTQIEYSISIRIYFNCMVHEIVFCGVTPVETDGKWSFISCRSRNGSFSLYIVELCGELAVVAAKNNWQFLIDSEMKTRQYVYFEFVKVQLRPIFREGAEISYQEHQKNIFQSCTG